MQIQGLKNAEFYNRRSGRVTADNMNNKQGLFAVELHLLPQHDAFVQEAPNSGGPYWMSLEWREPAKPQVDLDSTFNSPLLPEKSRRISPVSNIMTIVCSII